MKKIFIPLFVIAALSITSCRKSRTCTCTVTTTSTVGSSSFSSSSTQVDVWGHVTKREATGMGSCMDRKETTVNGSVTTDNVYACKIS